VNGANLSDRGYDIVEQRTNLWWPTAKVVREIMSPARMGLVAIGKPSTALRTLP